MSVKDTAKRIGTKVQTGKLSKETLKDLINFYKQDEGGLIPLLQKVQEREGYLSRNRLEYIAQEMNLSLAKVMGVVSFYDQFHTHPKGKNVIRICMGTACHVKGAAEVMGKFQEVLSVETGETTDDESFSLEAVSCVGACGLAPVITINHNTHGKVTPEKVDDLFETYQEDTAGTNTQEEEGREAP